MTTTDHTNHKYNRIFEAAPRDGERAPGCMNPQGASSEGELR